MSINSPLAAIFAAHDNAALAAADALNNVRAFAAGYTWDHPVIDADDAAELAAATLTQGLAPSPPCLRVLRGALRERAESLCIQHKIVTIHGEKYACFALFNGCARILVDATGGKRAQHWTGRWEDGWGPFEHEPRIGLVRDTIATADALSAERWGTLKAEIQSVKGKRIRYAGEVVQVGRVEWDDDLDDGYYIVTTDGRRLEISGSRPLAVCQ